MTSVSQRLGLGDEVQIDGDALVVIALAGNTVTLRDVDGRQSCRDLPDLLASADSIDRQPARAPALASQSSESVPQSVLDLEAHVLDSLGRPRHGELAPLPLYDPARTSQADRDSLKVAELRAAGDSVSLRTWQRRRAAYQDLGVVGLVDSRRGRPRGSSAADPRVIAAIAACIDARANDSTRTKGWVIDQVQARLVRDWPEDPPPCPSRATMYRLIDQMSVGKGTFGEGPTRRSLASSPRPPFGAAEAYRPGERIEIDSTRADVLILTPDGRQVRPELTVAVDAATRSVCAASLDYSTDSTDLTLILAEMVAPRRSHPEWRHELGYLHRMVPPEHRLASVEDREAAHREHAVIVPETIAVDLGPPYRSKQFRRACGLLGISLQLARPGTPTDKAIVERLIGSINRQFCQRLPGYTGRNAAHRGRDVQAGLTLEQVQDLLDEWVAVHWQRRPHAGLQATWGSPSLSPNTIHAQFVSHTGQVTLPLTRDDYISMLPRKWVAVHRYGVNHDRRVYDSPSLNELRSMPNLSNPINDRWALHYHPHNIFRVWLAGRDGWLELDWNHRTLFAQPFGSSLWAEAKQQAPERTEESIARTARALQEELFTPRPQSARAAAGDRPESSVEDLHSPDGDIDRAAARLDNFDPTEGLG